MTTQPKHLTVAEKVILKAASPELTCYEIAEVANVTPQSVYRAVRKFNLQVQKFKKDLTDEQKEKIRAMASPKTGVTAIKKQLGCTRAQVQWMLKKEGLPHKTINEKRTYQKSGSNYFRWEDFQNSVI